MGEEIPAPNTIKPAPVLGIQKLNPLTFDQKFFHLTMLCNQGRTQDFKLGGGGGGV